MASGSELVYQLPYQFMILVNKGTGRQMYHQRAASLRVPNNILHFSESSAPMMVICVLMKTTCS